MVDIVTRLGKGSPLTNAEVDANFTNLAEVSGVTGEPMGHEDRTTSTISFNASTRTFTIAPTASSFTVWCKGKKVVVSSARTVTIPNTTGMYSIYFDSTGALAAKSGYFTFAEEAPTAYIYWNATTGTAPYFGDERHGVVLDWQTHEYLHRTRGAALASGFSASGYVLGGNGSSNSHAQITLEGGTFFDEDMKIIVTATNTPTAGTWEQDLVSPARIPVLYLSGTAWVIDSPTDYPLKQGTARPQYNAYSGGVWSTADVANNKYATSWILATNNLTYPVIAIIGQAESDLQSAAEAVDFTALQLPGFPSVEFRPLYKLIFQCADSCTNAVHASLVSITDIRSIAAAGTAASIVTDHGNLSGLSDDDHPQYLSVDTVRGSLTAAVKASFLPSQTSSAGKFLQTDGTATSWQALTSGNVTTALGFTPYNATNPSGYITGISSSDVTTALGFTPYNATNPSGYVTAAGARGAISVTGAGSYDSATGVINIVGGVTSFNTRTGAITLSSSDVTTALGFTPYNNSNPSGYITGITSTMVTTALGYTPYNSSNPNGYISGITSGMVTTALGFTPYNNSNPSGYITSSALSGYLTSASAASTYLALSGGTMTGQITMVSGTPWQVLAPGSGTYNKHVQYINGTEYTLEAAFATDSLSGSKLPITFTWRGGYGATGGLQLTGGAGGTLGGNTILHAGNYSSYALPLSGGTVSGYTTFSADVNMTSANSYLPGHFYTNTWDGSNVYFHVGGSGSTTNKTLNLRVMNSSGGNSLYQFNINRLDAPNLQINGNQVLHAGNYSSYALPLSGGTLTGDLLWTGYPKIGIADNGADCYMYITDDNPTHDGVAYGGEFWLYGDKSVDTSLLRAGGAAFTNAPTVSGNRVLHAGNYNSYSPTLTGGNASGTWGINVTGYSKWVDRVPNYQWNNATLPTGYNSGIETSFVSAAEGWPQYGVVLSVMGRVPSDPGGNFQLYMGHGTDYGGTSLRVRSVNQSGNVWTSWKTLLDSSNYSSYALPLSGGTLTGKLTITPAAGLDLYRLTFDADGTDSWYRAGSGNRHRFTTTGGADFVIGNASGVATLNGNQVLHAGNYTSYSPSLGGSGASGTWGISISGNAATASSASSATDADRMLREDNRSVAPSELGAARMKFGFGSWNNNDTDPYADFLHLRSYSDSSGGADNLVMFSKNVPAMRIYQQSFGSGTVYSTRVDVLTSGNYTNYAASASHSHNYIPINPDGDGAAWTYSDDNPTINGVYVGGGQRFGADGSSYEGFLQAKIVNAHNGFVNSANGYYVGNYDFGANSNTYSTTRVIDGSGNVTGSEIYTNGWFRNNNSNQGLYNQSTGGHFYSNGSASWGITGNGGNIELQFRANHQSTIRGYVYGNTSNEFGLLNSTGNWAVRAAAGGGGYLHNTWSGDNIKANRANGNLYIDDNYGYGVVGVYSSYRYQGVFAMGDSYKMSADGTSLSNMYGIAWSHPNAGGAAGNLTDHGLLIINAGAFKCAISNSIVASANITAYSDERLKTNWRDMPENYVARLAQVKVGIYDRTDQEDVTQVGVSAQSFQKLLPQAIMTAKDEMQTLSVSYGNAALASAVELAKDNVELRARIERLESLINKLIGD